MFEKDTRENGREMPDLYGGLQCGIEFFFAGDIARAEGIACTAPKPFSRTLCLNRTVRLPQKISGRDRDLSA